MSKKLSRLGDFESILDVQDLDALVCPSNLVLPLSSYSSPHSDSLPPPSPPPPPPPPLLIFWWPPGLGSSLGLSSREVMLPSSSSRLHGLVGFPSPGGICDIRIGKVRIRLSTLKTDQVYTHSYPLVMLHPIGVKKMGELHFARAEETERIGCCKQRREKKKREETKAVVAARVQAKLDAKKSHGKGKGKGK